MSEDFDDGNGDVAAIWVGIIFLYLVGTAIWVYGWKTVLLVALSIVIIPTLSVLLVRLYLASETHRYREARRDIRRLVRWGKRQIRDL
jgi:hypothetical protein